MAGLADILRDAVAIMHDFTEDLQVTVKHHAVKRTSTDGPYQYNGAGEHEWEYPTTRTALLTAKQQMKRTADNSEKLSRYRMTLMEAAVKVDLHDKFTLIDSSIDGTELGPILAIESPLDPTGAPYVNEVWF